jgi:hypothetical protein
MNNGWLGFSLSPSAGRCGYGGGGGASASGDGDGSCSSPAGDASPLPLVAMPLQPDGSLHYTSAPGNCMPISFCFGELLFNHVTVFFFLNVST